MPIYGMLILQSIRCSPTLWAVTQPSQLRSIMDKNEFVREPQISLYISYWQKANNAPNRSFSLEIHFLKFGRQLHPAYCLCVRLCV